MKEYIGLTSWLESKFVERVLYHRLYCPYKNRAVSVPGIDDASSIEYALYRYNELSGKQRTVQELNSLSGTRKIGVPNGKDWSDYKMFIIPINTKASHNQSLILFPNTNPKKAIFVDPTGDEISHKRKKELQLMGFEEILSVREEVQKDGFRCGDYSISLTEAIVNSENPENLKQDQLNEIAKEIANLDKDNLDQKRAEYVKNYIEASELDPLIFPDESGIILSKELYQKIPSADGVAYQSPFIHKIEKEDVVRRHDYDARLKDSQFYHQYVQAELSSSVPLALEHGIEKENYKKIKRKINERSLKEHQQDIEIPIESEFQKKRKAQKARRASVKSLINEISILNKQIELLQSYLPAEEISFQLDEKAKEKLQLFDNQLQNEIENQLNYQKVIGELQEEIADNAKKINYLFLQLEKEGTSKDKLLTEDVLDQFISLEAVLLNTFKDNQEILDAKVKPLLNLAKAYKAKSDEFIKAELEQNILSQTCKKADDLIKNQVEPVARWNLLIALVMQAKVNYSLILKQENQGKVDQKFNQFLDFRGVSSLEINYKIMTYALFNAWFEMDRRGLKSNSMDLLEAQLSKIGITHKDFNDFKGLIEKNKKLNHSKSLDQSLSYEAFLQRFEQWELSESDLFTGVTHFLIFHILISYPNKLYSWPD